MRVEVQSITARSLKPHYQTETIDGYGILRKEPPESFPYLFIEKNIGFEHFCNQIVFKKYHPLFGFNQRVSVRLEANPESSLIRIHLLCCIFTLNWTLLNKLDTLKPSWRSFKISDFQFKLETLQNDRNIFCSMKIYRVTFFEIFYSPAPISEHNLFNFIKNLFS